MKTLAKYVSFIELHPCLPSYSYMFMLEAMTYKVDTMSISHFIARTVLAVDRRSAGISGVGTKSTLRGRDLLVTCYL